MNIEILIVVEMTVLNLIGNRISGGSYIVLMKMPLTNMFISVISKDISFYGYPSMLYESVG